jgi:AraC-like DNA-binding protein
MEAAFPFSVNTDASAGPGLFRLLLVRTAGARLRRGSVAEVLTAGTLLLLPPGSRCAVLPGADVRCACFGRSLIDPLALNGSVDLAVRMLGTTEPTIARLSRVQVEEAAGLFAAMEREAAALSPGFQGMVRLKLMEAILLLARARAGAAAVSPLRFSAEEAKGFILAHSADQLSLTDLAARYGLNPSYFSRLFSSHAGMPLVEFINRARIQKACQLLKRTDADIVEIAMTVGYNNLSHFNRYFRRIMGSSPREYRVGSRR